MQISHYVHEISHSIAQRDANNRELCVVRVCQSFRGASI